MRGGKDPNDFFSVFAINLQDTTSDRSKYRNGFAFGILFYNFFSKQFQLFIYRPDDKGERDDDVRAEEKYYGVFAREIINYLCGLKLNLEYFGDSINYYTYVNEEQWKNLFKFHFIFEGKNKLYSVRNNPDNSTTRKKVIEAVFESKLPLPEYEKREADVISSTEGTRWGQKNEDTHTFKIAKDNRNNIDFNLSVTLSKVVPDEVARKDYQPESSIFLKTRVISARNMAKAAAKKVGLVKEAAPAPAPAPATAPAPARSFTSSRTDDDYNPHDPWNR